MVVYSFSRGVHRLTERYAGPGVDITDALYAAEGTFVAELQRLVPAALVVEGPDAEGTMRSER